MATNTAELNLSAQRASEAAEAVKPIDNTASTCMLNEVQNSGLNLNPNSRDNIASSSQKLVIIGVLPSVTVEGSSLRSSGDIAQFSGSVEYSNTVTTVCKIANPNDCVRTTNGTRVEVNAGVGGVSVSGTRETATTTDNEQGTIENRTSTRTRVTVGEAAPINRGPDGSGSVVPTDSGPSSTSAKPSVGNSSPAAKPNVPGQTNAEG